MNQSDLDDFFRKVYDVGDLIPQTILMRKRILFGDSVATSPYDDLEFKRLKERLQQIAEIGGTLSEVQKIEQRIKEIVGK